MGRAFPVPGSMTCSLTSLRSVICNPGGSRIGCGTELGVNLAEADENVPDDLDRCRAVLTLENQPLDELLLLLVQAYGNCDVLGHCFLCHCGVSVGVLTSTLALSSSRVSTQPRHRAMI